MTNNPFALNRVAHELESARLALTAGDYATAKAFLVHAQEKLADYLTGTR